MPQRYRLLKDHPYAKKGTILEQHDQTFDSLWLHFAGAERRSPTIDIPLSVQSAWLEEVKEEVTFTREQADAIHSVVLNEGRYTYATLGDFLRWVDQHTSTEE